MVLRISRKDVVVVTGDVELREHSFRVRCGGGSGKRQRERASTVERSHQIGQLLTHRPAAFNLQLRDLIADSPDHNRGMIAIAQHHRRDIPLPPFVKVSAVIELDLVRLPRVERLVQDKKPEPVARVQKCG